MDGGAWALACDARPSPPPQSADRDARRRAALDEMLRFAEDCIAQWREGGPLLPVSMMTAAEVQSRVAAGRDGARDRGGWGGRGADVKLLRYLTIMAESTGCARRRPPSAHAPRGPDR